MVTVLVGEGLDLDVEGLALLGIAAGAVVALVPDATAARRLTGYLVGVVVALLGYFFRAALMPDTSTGRAITVGLVVLLGALVALVARDHLRLWSILLGSAVFAGAYEEAYAAAPPLVADTSVSTVTTLLLCSAVGYLTTGALAGDTSATGSALAPAHHDETQEIAR